MILKSRTHCDFQAWATPANGRVQLALGPLRYTCTAEEAVQLAAQLSAAAENLRDSQ
jgi:hypothetical protein